MTLSFGFIVIRCLLFQTDVCTLSVLCPSFFDKMLLFGGLKYNATIPSTINSSTPIDEYSVFNPVVSVVNNVVQSKS